MPSSASMAGPSAPQPAPATLPPGCRVYAVGDVHGCLDRLCALLDLIASDLAARPAPSSVLVMLGDYVDRGPDSAGVVGRLAAAEGLPCDRLVTLMGNHEAMMLDALDGRERGLWLDNGGRATLASYGLEARDAAAWRDGVPALHRAFLAGLALSHREGGYVFAHAGLRPGVPLARQMREDLLWIRRDFLDSDAPFGAVVVHGHTPATSPEVRANRIGIDTGAVAGGALTCVVLEGDTLAWLQA